MLEKAFRGIIRAGYDELSVISCLLHILSDLAQAATDDSRHDAILNLAHDAADLTMSTLTLDHERCRVLASLDKVVIAAKSHPTR